MELMRIFSVTRCAVLVETVVV